MPIPAPTAGEKFKETAERAFAACMDGGITADEEMLAIEIARVMEANEYSDGTIGIAEIAIVAARLMAAKS